MKDQSYRRGQGVKTPDTQNAGDNTEHKLRAQAEKSETGAVEKIGLPWQSMDTSPKDGMPAWLKSADGRIVEGYWRRTRQFRKGMWQEIFFWAVCNQNPQAVPFNPVCWTREQPRMIEAEDAA